jgi:hypothetical protein
VSETVRFTCQQVPREIGAFTGFAELNEYRRKLRELGMIGGMPTASVSGI